jgi:hypothetical protein
MIQLEGINRADPAPTPAAPTPGRYPITLQPLAAAPDPNAQKPVHPFPQPATPKKDPATEQVALVPRPWGKPKGRQVREVLARFGENVLPAVGSDNVPHFLAQPIRSRRTA